MSIEMLKKLFFIFGCIWLNTIVTFRSSNQRCSTATLLKKKTLAQLFSSEFCEISKNTSFTEHLRATASSHSENSKYVKKTWSQGKISERTNRTRTEQRTSERLNSFFKSWKRLTHQVQPNLMPVKKSIAF